MMTMAMRRVVADCAIWGMFIRGFGRWCLRRIIICRDRLVRMFLLLCAYVATSPTYRLRVLFG